METQQVEKRTTHTSIMRGVDEARTETRPGARVLRCMDPALGDYKVVWDPDRPDEVDEARRAFDKFKKKGHTAFRVKKDGSKADVLKEFDPDAEAIIMAPPVAGG